MTQIDYYFSLTSPWSFMGSERLERLAETHGARVNCIPANLGAVFAETGGLPLPKRSPQRQAYRMMELKRWTKFHDIPFVLEPKHFPYDESEGVRLVLAARKAKKDALKLATELGRALWQLDQDPADKQVQDEAARRAGLDADALRGGLSPDEAKAIWAENSEEAIRTGVFGAPSYVIEGEIFWGQDRLDFVEHRLAGE